MLGVKHFAPCKVIEDSIRFCIPCCGFRIPGAGLRILPVQIPDSKTQKIPDFSFSFASNFFAFRFLRMTSMVDIVIEGHVMRMHVCLFIFP